MYISIYMVLVRDPKQLVIEITWALVSLCKNLGAGVMGEES